MSNKLNELILNLQEATEKMKVVSPYIDPREEEALIREAVQQADRISLQLEEKMKLEPEALRKQVTL